MATKKYFWLKLKDDFFREKEIKKLRKIAGGDTYTIIYLKMLLLSLGKEGRLYFDGIEDSFAEEVALEIDEDVENVKVTVLFLKKCNLLEELSENKFMLIQAANNIGSETQGAERVRRFRESQKALLCNTGATNCNTEIEKEIEKEIELDKDKDKEKEIYKEKVSKQKTSIFSQLFKAFTNNAELLVVLEDFVTMRNKIKKPLTERAIKNILSKLSKFSDNDKLQMLEMSITNCWSDVYEKNKGSIKGGGKFDRGSNDTNGHYQGKELGDVF